MKGRAVLRDWGCSSKQLQVQGEAAWRRFQPCAGSSSALGLPPQPQIAHSGSFSQLLWWFLGQTTSGGPRGHPQSANLIRDKGFCTLGRQKTHQPLPTTGTELNLGSFPQQGRKTGTKLREKWPELPLRARTPCDPTANMTWIPQKEQHPCDCGSSLKGRLSPSQGSWEINPC